MERFKAIASDYDSTLAHEGRVAPETVRALRRARAAGRKLILITGRTLNDLRCVFSEIALFDIIVVENGAVIFDPIRGEEEALCAPPAPEFLEALAQRKIPYSLGKCVVATHRPHDVAVQQIIDQLKIDLAVALNRESVMVLPRGVDKASGLTIALERTKMKASEIVGIGDAENDLSFLRLCGFSAVVANAIHELKQQVDYVAGGVDGAGASEVIEQVIAGKMLVRTTK